MPHLFNAGFGMVLKQFLNEVKELHKPNCLIYCKKRVILWQWKLCTSVTLFKMTSLGAGSQLGFIIGTKDIVLPNNFLLHEFGKIKSTC